MTSFTSFASNADNCHAVIYNNSNKSWDFKFNTLRGNVYFSGVTCAQNGPCKIPAHAVVDLEYTFTTHLAVGEVKIADENGKDRNFGYFGKDACPKIESGDHQDGVNFNAPWQGGFTIVNDTWP